MTSVVHYTKTAAPSMGTTPIEVPGPPAAERHPWECTSHEWHELYRWFSFLNEQPHDTAEPPRTGDGKRKKRMDAADFDVEKNGATRYTTTPPSRSEIVYQCAKCSHTLPVKLPAAAEKTLRERYEKRELVAQHFASLSLADLMPGVAYSPVDPTLPTPTIPKWVPEQRRMQARIEAGLHPVGDDEDGAAE